MIETEFNDDMKRIYQDAKKELGYSATRYMQMLSQYGGLKTAKLLIAKNGSTYGFEVLWENKRLVLSVEALVLNPKYESLFTDEERKLCKDKLEEHGYDIN